MTLSRSTLRALTLALLFAGCGGPSAPAADSGQTDNECAQGTDNCSPNAACADTASGFTCTCGGGFTGDGVVCERDTCTSVGDCDDDVACTVDSCSASGSCLHTPSSALCENSAVCHPTAGCMVGRICGSPSDCVDSDPCTRDEMCNASSATCVFAPLDNDDDDEVPLVCGGTDCDDDDERVGAGRSEACGNGVDDDCNGVVDTDATLASDPNLRNSEANCGTCGNVCAQGETCYQGECEPCGTAGTPCCSTFCTSANSCAGGTCTNGSVCTRDGGSATCDTDVNCGAMGQACCAGSTCVAGSTCGTDNRCQHVGVCADAGTPILYRLTVLSIPTAEQGAAGATVGHNVDATGTTCGIPDYAGGVDNSLIDLAAALPALNPDDPIVLQAEINAALGCPAGSSDCTRLDLILSVATGTDCVVIEIENGEGANLAGPFVATRDLSGSFRGVVNRLSLAIPYRTDLGTVDINFSISSVIITGNVSQSALTNVVIGGALVRSAFETTIMELLPLLEGDIRFEDIAPTLAGLYDVQVNSQCTALSVGFLASGAPLLP